MEPHSHPNCCSRTGVFSVLTAAIFHSALADQAQFIHFFKNIAMAGGLLQTVAFGAGRFSLDARRQ